MSGAGEQLFDLTITDLSRSGSGLARSPEGQVVFVPLTAPGDQVRVRIVKTKKRYLEGEIVEILAPSSKRVIPRCAVFGRCGGCSWQHIPYALQWKTKLEGVIHALQRQTVATEGVFVEEFPATDPWSYRNRIQLRGQGPDIGFFRRGSRNLVPIERCEIARNELNGQIARLRAEGAKKPGEYKVEVEVLADGSTREAWNSRHAALGFRQVNDAQNKILRDWVTRQVPDAGTVWDLYGGSGNFATAVAESRPNVIAIHCVDQHAKAGSNGKIRYHAREVGKWCRAGQIQKFTTQPPLTLILDPPREGVGEEFSLVAEAAQSSGATAIVQVGCDPDAWARDVGRWTRAGWRLTQIAVVDLFPQTPHVESVARLERPA